MEHNNIKDNSGDKKYYIQVQKIIWALSRSTYDYTFWCTVKDLCFLEGGECRVTTKELAEIAMMSAGKASDCRAYFLDIGLLEGKREKDVDNKNAIWNLSVPDLWKKNIEVAKTVSTATKMLKYKRKQLIEIQKTDSPGELVLDRAKKRSKKKRKSEIEKDVNDIKTDSPGESKTDSPGEIGSTPGELDSTPGESVTFIERIERIEQEDPAPQDGAPTPPDEPARDEKPKEPSAWQKLVQAAADVCGMDVGIKRHVGQIVKNLSEIRGAKIQPTPELLVSRYGYQNGGGLPDEWNWYRHEWRGQRGDKPKPAQIVETWGNWEIIKPQAAPNGKGRYEPADRTLEVYESAMRAARIADSM